MKDRQPCEVCGSLERTATISVQAESKLPIIDGVVADSRYSFGPQFLCSAAFFAREAKRLEQLGHSADDDSKLQHVAFVVGAIMQSVSGLEAELAEVAEYGPGCHLGSNGIDHDAKKFLEPLADFIDDLPGGVVRRYDVVLYLLRKPGLDHGVRLWADSTLLVLLRNELVHYKSQWGVEMEPPDKPKAFFERLKQLNLARPPWIGPSPSTNFFPHQCLSAACACWAIKTAVALIDEFYDHLGVARRLEAFRSKLTT